MHWQSESIIQPAFILKQEQRFLTRAGERDTLRQADAWTAIGIEHACRRCLHVRARKGNRHEVERQRLEPSGSASH
jgi:hypothetical protein